MGISRRPNVRREASAGIEQWALRFGTQKVHSLKDFKEHPDEQKRAGMEARFDEIFTEKTCFATLNNALKRIHRNKPELLKVLEHPDIPLHNNLSENDIREYVKRRKISGSTRSALRMKAMKVLQTGQKLLKSSFLLAKQIQEDDIPKDWYQYWKIGIHWLVAVKNQLVAVYDNNSVRTIAREHYPFLANCLSQYEA